ncbi:MAG: acetyltransferase [Aestuariibacter sp.]
MKKLVIFGLGEIAELAHYYFGQDSNYEVVAFTVDAEYKKQENHLGLPVESFEQVEQKYPPCDYDLFIAVSYQRMNQTREQKFKEAKNKGYSLVSYISSKATTFENLIHGENCFVLEDNTIQPFAQLGDNVTLWSGNHIGHHAIIKSNSFITSHAVISGGVIIGKNSFIGVNATLHDHIKVGAYNLIGAGALVTRSTIENGVYLGHPAKLKRTDAKEAGLI